MLEKVERVTTDRLVADNLKKWIIDNKLQPGDRMPTEQQLCQELGVARHTLREGVKRLSQLGIVESRAGCGMYVSPISFDYMAEYMLFLMLRGDISYRDVSGVRTVLEQHAAELAARNADGAHIAALRSALDEMGQAYREDDWERYIASDVSFHLCLANATENQLLIGMLSAIRQLIQRFMSALDRNTVDSSYRDHRELMDAIERHDPLTARAVMERHLNNLLDKLDIGQ